ncbi:MAG: hypothetical protein H6613_03450 [Ignavibacteriales bacterium]|nr:hypothetical protein [Ignavibacteriales bacterium]
MYSCSSSTSVEESEKYFSPNNLEKLEIESYNEFWEINQSSDTLLALSTHFNSDPRILESLGFRSDNKGIEVSVFTSKEAAILSLEERINSVSCIISEGDSKSLEGKSNGIQIAFQILFLSINGILL